MTVLASRHLAVQKLFVYDHLPDSHHISEEIIFFAVARRFNGTSNRTDITNWSFTPDTTILSILSSALDTVHRNRKWLNNYSNAWTFFPPAYETFPELFTSLQKTAGKYAIASRQSSDDNQRYAFIYFFFFMPPVGWEKRVKVTSLMNKMVKVNSLMNEF